MSEETIRQIIRIASGMPENSVRPANGEAPTGDTEFATVLVAMDAATGNDESRYTPLAGSPLRLTEAQLGQHRIIASVQFFRGNAKERANQLGAKLNLTEYNHMLRNAGIGLVRVSAVRDLSALQQNKFEARAQVDVEFHVVAKVDTTIDTFGTFPISVTRNETNFTNEVFEP